METLTARSCRKIVARSAVWHAMRLCGVSLGTPGADDVVSAITWIIRQQEMVLNRFPTEQNDGHTQEGLAPDSYWHQKFTKFLHRADLLGLDGEQGRQAVAEFAATAVGLLASVWRAYGPPDLIVPKAKCVKVE